MSSYLKITRTATLWLIVLACISINLPTAIMSITNSLLIILWIISGQYKEKANIIIKNPTSLATLGLISAYLIGISYSSATLPESFKSIMHYHKLFIIPIIISTLTQEKYQNYALNGFLFSSIATMCISYLKWIGVIPHIDTGEGYIAFKNRIAGSIIMSFSMYLMLQKAKNSSEKIKYLWIIASLLAMFDIAFLMNGRTGQLLMIALTIWFTYETWGNKCIKYWIAFLALGFIIIQTTPELPQSRLTNTQSEIENHNISGQQTSAGLRLEFYKNSLTLIKENILFGTGTGSFLHEYKQLAEQKNLISKDVANPHNQFLLTTEELGLMGLITLFLFWYIPWLESKKLPTEFNRYALRALILTMCIGSLFNSLLFDASEGKFYCILAGVLLSINSTKNI
ncbi:MAG: O-antigen ligase family protein [Methylomonas sp.]